ncbi:MAG: ABC transporter permease [Caldilineaceae bacterium]|nr:ABC transporter permease [Caldilineaceae bacterium]
MTEASQKLPTTLNTNPKLIAKGMQKHRTLWQDATRRFFRNRLAVLGFVIVLFLLFLAIFADLLAPYNYAEVDFTVRHPQLPFVHPNYLLGTDPTGRDYLSRLIYGARTSMAVGLILSTIAVIIGLPIGAAAGYFGGKVDFIVTRVVEILTAFPGLLFAILIVSVLGGGFWKVILALSITSWVGMARLVRGQILSLREKEYVEAARSLGARQTDIIFRHLLPNILSPVLVAVSFGIPGAMFGEAGLSFLGLGINDPTASWGKMVGISGAYVRVYWHLALFPTLAIALAMLGFSFVGDGLRDALDPKLIE